MRLAELAVAAMIALVIGPVAAQEPLRLFAAARTGERIARGGPAYGLAVLRGAHPGAKDLALFVLGEQSQRMLPRFGFISVGLP